MAEFYEKDIEQADKSVFKVLFVKHKIDGTAEFDGAAEPRHVQMFAGEYQAFLDSKDPKKQEASKEAEIERLKAKLAELEGAPKAKAVHLPTAKKEKK